MTLGRPTRRRETPRDLRGVVAQVGIIVVVVVLVEEEDEEDSIMDQVQEVVACLS